MDVCVVTWHGNLQTFKSECKGTQAGRVLIYFSGVV